MISLMIGTMINTIKKQSSSCTYKQKLRMRRKDKRNNKEPCLCEIRLIVEESPQTAKGDTFFLVLRFDINNILFYAANFQRRARTCNGKQGDPKLRSQKRAVQKKLNY